ncbi:MAG TPA: tetratricopeptide repeat protein [Longimicrobiales bacterium]|nr:tetratricopeptide repeat protein [Longimicrobiales bacterium]
MDFLKKLFGGPEDRERVDYYREGMDLLGVGRFHEALTSFRLALREDPGDVAILQQIAITYTRIGMTDEAAKTYRTVLERDPTAVGAHYGLAFLLLRDGRTREGADHLRRFLAEPPDEPSASQHVEHARSTLAELEAQGQH